MGTQIQRAYGDTYGPYDDTYGLVWQWGDSEVSTQAEDLHVGHGVHFVMVSFNLSEWAAERFWNECDPSVRAEILGRSDYGPPETMKHPIYGFVVFAQTRCKPTNILEAMGY